VNNEPFAVILADDLIDSDVPALRQMVEVFERKRRSVIAVQSVAREETSSYGIISGDPEEERIIRMSQIVEKPKPQDAPSTLGVVGRYILTPTVFKHLEQIKPGAGGEIQLTDGIAATMKEEGAVGYQFDGVRYDCGSKLGYLQANVMYGIRHSELGQEFFDFLKRVVG
jgi:UTP--glucose-1-phosphate uridylyltransferase